MDVDNQAKAEHITRILLESMDDPATAGDLARKAFQSRSGFFRLFQALIDETPAAMRRRLLLERAAWQLRDTRLPVTEIAFNAGYGSLEAFTRAFQRAFHVSPSLFRRTCLVRIHLPAPNHFHFQPAATTSKGDAKIMDLFDLFAGTESWYTRRLLQQAATLTDEQLDRPVNSTAKPCGWYSPDKNLREILERIVQTKEIWTAAITGGQMPALDAVPAEHRTPAAMLDRFEKADARFHSIVKDVRDRGAWDESFVDALCEPPETFTYGGMFADVITFNIYRRLAAMDAFHRLGVHIQGSGSPIEYQQSKGGASS
jgi:AraC-like DNA-binding protein